jgi:hypothetical protein
MDKRLIAPRAALQAGIGLMATLAGLDKFFNILADWQSYVAPVAVRMLPVPPEVFMRAVGVVEIAVGVTILAVRPAIGAYAASGWLLLVAANLVLGGHFDIAVRDVVLSLAAFTLARLCEVQATATEAVTSRARPDAAFGTSPAHR